VTKKDPLDVQPTDVVGLGYRPALPEKLRLLVVAGPDKGRFLDLAVGTYFIGKAPSCELALTDTAVSRRHLEITVMAEGLTVRDLGSTNGSYFNGARFDTITVGAGASLVIGQTELELVAPDTTIGIQPSTLPHFGELVGDSTSMRQVFTVLVRVAATDACVLVQGETGTGKELVAEAIHANSPRKNGPFVICDLGALPRSLIESELFGHVRGAFTGADRDREGAFSQADGGTIFLDEVGELDAEVQPRLLRALERRQIKPVGTSMYRQVDVRVIAATNRDLTAEVKAGRFREDLYHRLAVVRVQLPPVRERREDIPLLVEHFLEEAAIAAGRQPPSVPPGTMAALVAHDWPGNVRELRNVLERALSLAPDRTALDPVMLGLDELSSSRPVAGSAPSPVDVSIHFKEAKDRLIQAWEREYVEALLSKAQGNVSLAARQAGIDRVYLHRLMKKHGLGG
jgi:two-component system nitrogen regulation response regulator GlnG